MNERAQALHYTGPMRPAVRLLLIWLVALALPAQGIAAATMQFCGPGHRQQVQSAPAAGHAHHAHHAAAAADDSSAPAAQLAQLGKFKCSACAACCMATALPPAMATLPVVKPAIGPETVAPLDYVGPVAAGLERPPKPTFA